MCKHQHVNKDSRLKANLKAIVANARPSIPPKDKCKLTGWLVKRGNSYKSWYVIYDTLNIALTTCIAIFKHVLLMHRHLRFFSLRDQFLWYAKAEDSTEPLGLISLAGCTVLSTNNQDFKDVRVSPYRAFIRRLCARATAADWIIALVWQSHTDHRFEFLIDDPNVRTWHIRAGLWVVNHDAALLVRQHC